MGGDCGVYGEDNGIEKFLVGKPVKKRDDLKYLGIDGNIKCK